MNSPTESNYTRTTLFCPKSNLKRSLQQLKDQLPNPKDEEAYKQWWLENGEAWTEQLRSVMIEHRNIGDDRHLTASQKRLLQQLRL